MLPKPTEETRRAIVSVASTARLVSEVGLSVAGKGGCSLASIFGVFSLVLWRFWIILCHFGIFWAFQGTLWPSCQIVNKILLICK